MTDFRGTRSSGAYIGRKGASIEQKKETKDRHRIEQIQGIENLMKMFSIVKGGTKIISAVKDMKLKPIKMLQTILEGEGDKPSLVKDVLVSKPVTGTKAFGEAIFGDMSGKAGLMINPDLGISNLEELTSMLNEQQLSELTKIYGEGLPDLFEVAK